MFSDKNGFAGSAALVTNGMVIDGSGGTSIQNLVYSVIRNGTAANKFGGTTVSFAPTDDVQGGCSGLLIGPPLSKSLTQTRRLAERVQFKLVLGRALPAAPVFGTDPERTGGTGFALRFWR